MRQHVNWMVIIAIELTKARWNWQLSNRQKHG